MKSIKSKFIRGLSLMLALILVINIPVSVFATESTDTGDYSTSLMATYDAVRAEMMASDAFKALKYLGYDQDEYLEDRGYLFQSGYYGGSLKKKIEAGTIQNCLTNIGYSSVGTGMQTSSTPSKYEPDVPSATGKYPNVAKFEDTDLDCVDYVTYHLTNYMPNIVGTEYTVISDAMTYLESNEHDYNSHYDNMFFWDDARSYFKNHGVSIWEVTDVDSKSGEIYEYISKDGVTCTDDIYENLPIGCLIQMGELQDLNDDGVVDETIHYAIYAGTYNGTHFIYHCGNSRGPEISRVESMAPDNNNSSDKKSVALYFYDFNSSVTEYGSVTVHKEDEKGNGLEGAKFKLTNVDNGDYWVLTTDSTGTATKDGLILGNYTIQETAAPDGYILDETKKSFELTTDKPDFTYTAINEGYGGVRIYKYNKNGTSVIAGAVFAAKNTATGAITYCYDATSGSRTFTDPISKKSVTVTADGNGNGVSTFNTLPLGNYQIYEAAAPENYIRGTTVVPVKLSDPGQFERIMKPANEVYTDEYLDANGNPYHLFFNDAFGQLQVIKYNEDATKAIPGAVFAFKNTSTGDIIYRYDADSGSVTFTDPITKKSVTAVADGNGNGSLTLVDLRCGTYEVYEAKAPTGYIRDGAVVTVVLETPGQVERIVKPSDGNYTDAYLDANGNKYHLFTNTPYGQLQVHKYNEDASKRIAGAVFAFKNTATGEIIYRYDANSGSVTFTDPITKKPVTAPADELGNGSITLNSVPLGTYEVYEAMAPTGYVRDATVVTVKLTTPGQFEAVAKPSDGNYTDTYLDANGNKYHLFTNAAFGQLQVHKYNADTSGRIPGAVFAFKNTATGEIIYRYDANEGSVTFTDPITKKSVTAAADGLGNGSITLSSIPLGTYQVYEAMAPTNYIRDTTVVTVKLTTPGQFETVSKPSDGNYTDSYLDANGNPYHLFTNTPYGVLQVVKYNEDATKLIPGAVFAYKNTATGEIIYRYDADEGSVTFTDPITKKSVTAAADGLGNGSLTIITMPLGTYEVYEAKAPDGYVRDEAIVTVVLDTPGQTERIMKPGNGNYTAEYLDADGNKYHLFTNTPYGQLQVHKYNADATGRLTGAVFAFKNTETGEIIYRYDSKSGTVTFTDPVTNQTVTAEADGLGNGSLTLISVPLGTYEIYEAKAPDGYTRDKTIVTVILDTPGQFETVSKPGDGNYTDSYLDADGNPYHLFTNTPASGVIVVHKRDKDDVNLKLVPGAVFGCRNMGTGEVFYQYDAAAGVSITFIDPVIELEASCSGDGDANGIVTFSGLPYGDYQVYEIVPPEGYELSDMGEDGDIAVILDSENPSYISEYDFQNEPYKGSLEIEKKTEPESAATAETLAGWQFLVYVNRSSFSGAYIENGVYRAKVTDSDGNVSYYHEGAAELTAVIDTAGITLSLDLEGDGLVYQWEVSTDGGTTWSSMETAWGGPYISDSTGRISVTDLPIGGYYVVELDTGREGWFYDATPKAVTVQRNTTATVTFTNMLGGYGQIIKDTPYGGTKEGWLFNVWDPYGDLMEGCPFVTDANGFIALGLLISDDQYTIEEIGHISMTEEELSFWAMHTEAESLPLIAGETATVTFTNQWLGKLSGKKTSVNSEIVEGWIIQIETPDGTVVDTVTTDVHGEFLLNIAPGEYVLREIGHIDETMDLSNWILDAPKTVTVTAGEITEVAFSNTLMTRLTVTKESIHSDLISGWLFEIEKVNDDGTLTSLGTETTDANGEFTLLMAPGTYIVTEKGHSDSSVDLSYWVLDSAKEITLTVDSDTEITFTNTQFGKGQINKETTNGGTKEGWLFDVRDAEGSLIEGSPFITDANGNIDLDLLVPGTYTVTEIGRENDAGEYWILDEEAKTLEVTAGGTTSVSFTNRWMGKLAIQKEMTDDGPLEGWEFIIRDSEGNEIPGSPFVTDTDGQIFTGLLEPGIYTVEEIIPEGSIYQCIGENPRTVEVAAGETYDVTFVNALRSGSVTVNKVDGSNGQPLAGAVFLLEWLDGETWTPVTYSETILPGGCNVAELVDGCLTSGEDGIITFTGLHPTCQYRLTETKAPNGYTLKADYIFTGALPIDTLTLCETVENSPAYIYPPSGSIGAPELHHFGMACAITAMICMLGVYIWLLRSRKYVIDVTDVDNNFKIRRLKQ